MSESSATLSPVVVTGANGLDGSRVCAALVHRLDAACHTPTNP